MRLEISDIKQTRKPRLNARGKLDASRKPNLVFPPLRIRETAPRFSTNNSTFCFQNVERLATQIIHRRARSWKNQAARD